MSIFYREPVETSTTRKAVLVLISVLSAFLTSGIIYGYSGLLNVLEVDALAFAETCGEGEAIPCENQRLHLTACYTLGAATISACAIVVGVLLDAVGPRLTVIVGTIIFSGGLASIAVAQSVSSSLYYVAFFLLSLGGPCMFNAQMNFAELFPSQSAIVTSAQNGAFDMSSFVMFAMGKAVPLFKVSLPKVVLYYLVVPVVMLIVGLFLFPDRPYGSGDGKSSHGELWRTYMLHTRSISQSNLANRDSAEEPLLEKEQAAPPPPEVFNTPFKKQINSEVFWIQALVGAYLILRANFYIGSVSNQMQYIALHSQLDPAAADALANKYVDIFNYILPIGGAIMVPIAGWVMVNLGMVSSFIIIGAMSVIFSLINAFYWLPIQFQIVSFLFYGAARPFIFGATAAFIGRVFGFENFGRLYGVSRFAGAISTCLQYPLTSLANQTLGGNYFWINIGFAVCELLVGVLFPIYLWKRVFYGFFFRPPVAELEAIDTNE